MGLGYRIIREKTDRRRIFLVSLPTDSPGAGLVALGAMRQRLESPDANDLSRHYERIKRGVVSGDSVARLRRTTSPRTRYQLDCLDKDGTLWLQEVVANTRKRPRNAPPRFPGRVSVNESTAAQWLFEGEAPLQLTTGDALPWASIYDNLPLGSSSIISPNLATTDSAICLAGRISGAATTKALCDSLLFHAGGAEATLSELLTIGWESTKTISRVALFNSRTNALDRETAEPLIVVADGDRAFLTALSKSTFSRSDVVGVINRTTERERLESIAMKLEELRQWYEPEPPCPTAEAPPKGINLATLCERQA